MRRSPSGFDFLFVYSFANREENGTRQVGIDIWLLGRTSQATTAPLALTSLVLPPTKRPSSPAWAPRKPEPERGGSRGKEAKIRAVSHGWGLTRAVRWGLTRVGEVLLRLPDQTKFNLGRHESTPTTPLRTSFLVSRIGTGKTSMVGSAL